MTTGICYSSKGEKVITIRVMHKGSWVSFCMGQWVMGDPLPALLSRTVKVDTDRLDEDNAKIKQRFSRKHD